jgi:uncharacterized protein (TIGR03067 family)
MFKFLYAALAAALVVQLLSSPLEIHAADPKADPLQGTWTQVGTEQDGKVKSALPDPFTLVVSGSTVRLRYGEQLIREATIKRHPADKAGQVKFDLMYDRTKGKAPPPAEDGANYGILHVRGDELKFTLAHVSGDSERPKDFATTGKAGAGRRVFTWHRSTEKPAPLGIKLP